MKQLATIFIAILVSFTSINIAKAQVNKQDSLALVDFYNSTNGSNWTNNANWLTKEPVSTWNGIILDTNERVSQINLYTNNLTGVLPSSIGNLVGLQSISLHINKIGGSLPSSLGRLTNLNSLDLGENAFTGTIPDSLSKLIYLNALDLDGCSLTGAIPFSIGNLVNLQYLWLQYNLLSDSIPSSIGSLSNLQYLVLQNNQLSGAIPSSIANLSGLQGLFLQDNNFTFDGLELVAGKFPFAQYSPQAPIKLYGAWIPEGGPVGLSVNVGGIPANITYSWYDDSELVATIKGSPFYNATTSGYYNVAVTDSLVPGLTLYSDTLNISTVPIKSIGLQARQTNGQVLLQWQTIGEDNAASFIIQRSTHGASFTDIGTESAVGKGNNSYGFTDKTPVDGLIYYRIKAIDKDGFISYSPTTQLSIVNSQLSIFPIPARERITIKGNDMVQLKVMNSEGKVVLSRELTSETNQDISVAALPAGAYMAVIKTKNGGVSTLRFIKE